MRSAQLLLWQKVTFSAQAAQLTRRAAAACANYCMLSFADLRYDALWQRRHPAVCCRRQAGCRQALRACEPRMLSSAGPWCSPLPRLWRSQLASAAPRLHDSHDFDEADSFIDFESAIQAAPRAWTQRFARINKKDV